MAQVCAYTYAVIVWMNFGGFGEFCEYVTEAKADRRSEQMRNRELPGDV